MAANSGASGSAAEHHRPRASKKKPVLLGVAGMFVLYASIAYFVIGEPWTETNQHGVEVMSGRALSTVCEGKGGAEGTRAFEPGSDRHAMQVAWLDDGTWKRVSPPYSTRGFEGEPATEIEMVACYEPAPNPPVERCRFEDGAFVTSIEFPSIEVEVREASTGELIDSNFIRPESRDCPFGVMVVDGESTTKSIHPAEELDDYLIEFTDPD